MTATNDEWGTLLKAGPLFFSVTSPHPTIPQLIVSFFILIFWVSEIPNLKSQIPKSSNLLIQSNHLTTGIVSTTSISKTNVLFGGILGERVRML
jgi:hypothetical protein